MCKDIPITIELKIRGGKIMLEKLMIGAEKDKEEVLKDIISIKELQDEINSHNYNFNQDDLQNDSLNNSFVFGSTYSCY